MPFGLKKGTSWEEVAAKATADLTDASDTAEDLASRVKDLYKDDAKSTDAVRAAYDQVRGAVNHTALQIRVLLVLGKKAPDTPVDLTSIEELQKAFEDKALKVIKKKTDGKELISTWAGVIPSLGDIAKVFDSIMKAIEWFKARKDTERHDLADIIEKYEVRTWSEAGTPRKDKAKTPTKTPAKKSSGGDGGN